MKHISQNSLEELQALMREIDDQIGRYSHVSEHLPKSLLKAIVDFGNKLAKELLRREKEE